MLRTLLLSLLIASSLTACGNKGPLVLPDQAAQKDKDKDKDKSANATPATTPATTGDSTNKH
jgi:predicted small lipoprotein YifL